MAEEQVLNTHNAEILLSAANKSHYPQDDLPEVALAGRANVGKSSFINTLLGRKNLARTSGKPGKTQLLNFYNIDVHTEDGLALFKSLKLIGVPQSVFFKEGVQNEAIPGAINQTIIRKELADILGEKPQGFMGKLKGLFGI